MKLLLTLIAFIMLNSACSLQSEKEMAFQIEEATISSIHKAFSAGELSSSDLVEMYIDRIGRYDQPTDLNAIVIINPQAIKEAMLLDSLFLATGELLPLHGIPVIVKDNMDTRGLQTASGSAAMRGFEPVKDAFIVKRLRDAGAIVLAKSNMAEWAFSPMVTISSLAGETLNPYNLGHVPAGSSGGTAASVASNFGTVGLGTDTGNSIRGPSSHNSLVGFRTTIGLVSRGGISPLYLRNDVAGPMTRTVEDAVRTLNVIAGYDPADPITINSQGKIPDSYIDYLDKDGLKGARIGVLRELTTGKIDPEIEQLLNNALVDIVKLGGIIIDPVVVPDFAELASGHWASAFQFDLNNYLLNEPGSPVNTLEEIVAAGNYSEYIESRLLYHFEHNQDPEKNSPPALDAYNDPGRIKFRKAIEDVMDQLNLDAIVYPSWNYKPARVNHFEEYLGDNSQIIAPHTGQPAFTVPMGFASGNLPAGLQFLGRMFDEPKLIQLVYSFEQGTKHRKAPVLFSEKPE